MINQKCVLRGFSKYFLLCFMINMDMLLIPWEDCSERPTIKKVCYFLEICAHRIGRILF